MSTLSTSTDVVLNYDGSTFLVDAVVFAGPLTIVNTHSDPQKSITVTFDFAAAIANVNDYVIVGSDRITFEGKSQVISVEADGYAGLIANSDGYEDIVVNRVSVSVNNFFGTQLSEGGGWIGHEGFQNGTFNYCEIQCMVSGSGGGILGANGVDCTLNNCHASTFFIIDTSGGMVGVNAQRVSTFLCSSSGTISSGSGGIFASGAINCLAVNCSSSGAILNQSGGIFGPGCNSNVPGSTVIAIGCWSSGAIGGFDSYDSGGIFGPGANGQATDGVCQAIQCCSTGVIYGDDGGFNGGIFGLFVTNCQAISCFSSGDIGPFCGGIFSVAGGCTATNCYSVGAIDRRAGGIFGNGCPACTADQCYSAGPTIGPQAGGIFGQGSSFCTATACYSLGTLDIFAGGLFGSDSEDCVVQDSYTLGDSLFGIGVLAPMVTNSIAETGGVWSDVHALSTLASRGRTTSWLSPSANLPFLLTAYNVANLEAPMGLIPSGFQSVYQVPAGAPSTITANGTKTWTTVTGYYTDPALIQQSTTSKSDVSASSYHSPLMYGYTLTTQTVNVNVDGGAGSSSSSRKHSKSYRVANLVVLIVACVVLFLGLILMILWFSSASIRSPQPYSRPSALSFREQTTTTGPIRPR